jgi:hypothetical protein
VSTDSRIPALGVVTAFELEPGRGWSLVVRAGGVEIFRRELGTNVLTEEHVKSELGPDATLDVHFAHARGAA